MTGILLIDGMSGVETRNNISRTHREGITFNWYSSGREMCKINILTESSLILRGIGLMGRWRLREVDAIAYWLAGEDTETSLENLETEDRF